MTRRDHRGRFTTGSRPDVRETGIPLLTRHAKSAPHVRGHQTRRAKRSAWVWAHIAALRASA